MKHRIQGKLYPGDKEVWYAINSVPKESVSIGDEVELYDEAKGISVSLRIIQGTKCDDGCWCYRHTESSSCRSIFGCVKPRSCVKVMAVGDLMEEL